MATEFKLPLLAEGISSADVAELHVAAGDTVEEGQILMELETDKAVMELPSPQAGKISSLLVKKGDTVQVGQAILSFDAAGAPAPAATNGETVKAAAAPVAEAAPVPAAASRATAAPPASTNPWADGKTPIAAGPATRRMARELGVELAKLTGSGSGGRITSEDVARAYAAKNSGGSGGGIAVSPLPDFSQFGPVEKQAYTRLQKTVANNLSLAWQIIPHVTQHDLADITDIEAARKRFVENAGKNAPKVTMTAITMKAVVACLQQFPHFNSSYDPHKSELILKKFYHIGVAVDTPTGLVVPVIRDVDQKSVVQLANELTTIAGKARDGKLSIDDMRGGTFTITNLGGIGGTAFTPIVNYPEVAILGMSRSQKQLQLSKAGDLEERLMLPFSMSYDHRVINGADAARFLVRLASMFTDPFRLLVEC
ncbi:biotin/lipoyl-binding protein [bacterium]|nr:biotin/lipoyl-binding protein [bacterium]